MTRRTHSSWRRGARHFKMSHGDVSVRVRDRWPFGQIDGDEERVAISDEEEEIDFQLRMTKRTCSLDAGDTKILKY